MNKDLHRPSLTQDNVVEDSGLQIQPVLPLMETDQEVTSKLIEE